MKVQGLNSCRFGFTAHTYKICPKNCNVSIQTYDENNLGETPYLVGYMGGKRIEKKMLKNGDLHSFEMKYNFQPFLYHIEYKDTGKLDKKNGEEYCLNADLMLQEAAVATRSLYRQPLVHAIKEGRTVGKIKWQVSNIFAMNDDITEPTILLTRKFRLSNLDNPNIVGLILTSDNPSTLSHESTRLRQETDVCGAVYKPEIIQKLISLDGKNVELEIKDNEISFKETNKQAKPIEFNTIDVPKLKPCCKILTSKEYMPDVIGAKAVNLRRLEELKEQGKIDVIIPKSIALPSGYLEQFFYNCNINEYNDLIKLRKKYMQNGKLDNLIKILKGNGIDGKDGLMIRSAFNGEDLPNYSAAGIYASINTIDMDTWNLFYGISTVTNSKYCENAVYSRKIHNIPEENIQPGIILQERIIPNHRYTIYTDDNKGNLKIEMYSDIVSKDVSYLQPNIFTYNKKTGELSYDSVQMGNPTATFSENGELTELEPLQYDLSNNRKIFRLLEKVIKNALAVEKAFGKPQDIEGGIKGEDIYFWQTRNIVN